MKITQPIQQIINFCKTNPFCILLTLIHPAIYFYILIGLTIWFAKTFTEIFFITLFIAGGIAIITLLSILIVALIIETKNMWKQAKSIAINNQNVITQQLELGI